MAQTLMIAVGDTAERLRPKILERIAKLKVGDGMEPGTRHGPDLLRRSTASRSSSWIDRGEAEGAELARRRPDFVHPEHPDGFFLGVVAVRPRHARR